MKVKLLLRQLLLLSAGVLWIAQSASADLIHRYSFNESPGSTTVTDSIEGSNGVARVLTGTAGSVTFDGSQATLNGQGGYIDLPNGLVSGLTNVTIEAWVTKTAPVGAWERIFDFGTSDAGEDPDGTQTSLGNGGYYMFLTASVNVSSMPRFAVSDTIPGYNHETPILNDPSVTDTNTEVYYVVTYGPSGARLFVDGVDVADGDVSIPLSTIQDVNVWLGRSLYGGDSFFSGSFNEFRIHDSLLSQLQILASQAAGPNSIDYTPEAPNSIKLVVNSGMTVGTTQSPQINADFPTYGSVVLGASEVTLVSSNTDIVSVESGNVLKAVAPGTATIFASLSGKTSTATVTVTPPNVYTVLKHRYSFNDAADAGTVADSVGGATYTGYVYPPTDAAAPPVVVSNGVANFPGGDQANCGYIALPANMISSEFTNLTVEFWVTWNGPANGNTWARVFDFGSSNKGNDPHVNNSGLSYLMFTPRRGGGGARNEFRASADNANNFVSSFNDQGSSPGFPVGRLVHVVSTFAPGIQYSALYIDGSLVNIGTTPIVGTNVFQLSQLVDPNMWLGVSQWYDPPLDGQIAELRLYEGVLSELQIALSQKAGPDALPVSDPGTLQSIALQVSPAFINDPVASQATLLGTYQNVSDVDITTFNGVQLQSSDTNVFTVSATGAMTPVSVGTASLIANYDTFSTTSSVSVLGPVSLSVPATTVDADGANFTLPLFADFGGENTNVDVTGFNGVTRTSSDTNVAMINNAGLVTYVRGPGTTTITSTYAGLTNQSLLTVSIPAGFVRGTLIHRYSFSEAKDSTTVKDSVGTADGEVVDLQTGLSMGNFNGTGQFVMGAGPFMDPPTTNAYINLPNGLISGLSSVTIEGWFTWFGGDNNQRVFDFGMSSGFNDGTQYLEDYVANPGRSYFFLSPQTGFPRFAMKQGTAAETPSLSSALSITTSNLSHFAIVYDQPRGVVRLYINGQRAGTAAATLPLSVVDDRNDWIGRSQWQDPYYNGSIDEFRIYNGASLDSDIAADFAAGPDSLAVAKPTLNFSKSGNNIVLSWSDSTYSLVAAGKLTDTFTNVSGASSSGYTVPTTGTQMFFRLMK